MQQDSCRPDSHAGSHDRVTPKNTSPDEGHAQLRKSLLQSVVQSPATITSMTVTPPDTTIGEGAKGNTRKSKTAEAKLIPAAQKMKTNTALGFRPVKIDRETKKETTYGPHAINVMKIGNGS